MSVPSASDALDDDDSDFVRSSLHVKAATAAHLGRVSLGRLTTETVARRRLAARIERNAARAEDAVRRLSTYPTTESATEQSAAPRRLAAWLSGVAAAAAVAAFAVVVVPNIIGTADGVREQTLAGLSASSDPSSPLPPSPPAPESSGPAAQPTPSASPTTILAVAFDELTMNSGLGAEWTATGGDDAVEVAPIPNAVNRSARLVASGSAATEACTDLPAVTGELTLTVDVMLSASAASAQLLLDAVDGRLTASYGPDRSTLSGGGSAALELNGINPGEWYRSVISVTRGGEWELTPLEADATGRSAMLENATGIGPPLRVCIGVKGDAGSSAYFDNLTITEGGKNS